MDFRLKIYFLLKEPLYISSYKQKSTMQTSTHRFTFALGQFCLNFSKFELLLKKTHLPQPVKKILVESISHTKSS